jgi:drug/metabolite transporter (DMT)-like permease
MTARASSRLLLLAAAFLFSTGGAAIKAASLTGWQIACLRSAVAAIALASLVPAARRGWRPRTAAVGIAYAATLILFVLANRLTTSANAIFLQSTGPLYLLVIAPVALHERIRRSDLLFAAAVAGGLSLFFVAREGSAATAPDPASGNILALVSGFTWALVVAGLRWMGRGSDDAGASSATVVAGNLIACAISLPMALPFTGISLADALVILYLGVFQIGLAYWCLTRGLRHVPAFEASTLILLEPVLNPVWAWIVHGERPASLALAGGAIILGASVVNTWRAGFHSAPLPDKH